MQASGSTAGSWDPESTFGYAQPELALAESLDWFGPTFARWVASLSPTGGATTYARQRVLRVLSRRGPQRPGEVASELGCTAATLTGLIDGLVDDGLVARSAHPNDRRSVLLSLTAAGTAASQDSQALQAATALFDGMSRKQVLELLETTKELSTRLRAATSSASRSDGGPRPTPNTTAAPPA